MNEEKQRTYLNTIKEMILDEERLITYVSISKDFCIHVNESKFLMNKVVEEIRKKQPDTMLNVNYIISGLTDDNKARTRVCSVSDANDHRKTFKLLFFDHIYSINKGKRSVDKVAYMAISTFEDYQLCAGLVKSNECSKLTSDEIGTLKLNSQVQVTDQKVTKPLQKKVTEENAKDTNMNVQKDIKKEFELKSESKIIQENVSPQKDNLNNKKQTSEVKNTHKPQKGIAGFFSKSDSASVKKSTTVAKKNEPSDTKVKLEQMDVDKDIVVKDSAKTNAGENGEETLVYSVKNKKESTKSKNNNKSLTQIKKNAKVDKKRKRVLHISDSESDQEKDDPFDDEDVFNKQINIDSEDEIPPTPAANTVKIASNLLNPRKRRKIVNKTYTDEDGYILTKKEEVYESLSENEDSADTKENIEKKEKKNTDESSKAKTGSFKLEVSPNKKNGPKNNRKKISPPQKGKQATLMNFFKKA